MTQLKKNHVKKTSRIIYIQLQYIIFTNIQIKTYKQTWLKHNHHDFENRTNSKHGYRIKLIFTSINQTTSSQQHWADSLYEIKSNVVRKRQSPQYTPITSIQYKVTRQAYHYHDCLSSLDFISCIRALQCHVFLLFCL